MLAGEPYLANDPELTEGLRRAARLMEAYNRTPTDRAEEARRILAELLGALGEGVQIRPPFYCDYGDQISIGARTFANYGLVALDVASIRIGEDVQIGPYVQLLPRPTRSSRSPAVRGSRAAGPSSSATTCGLAAASLCARA